MIDKKRLKGKIYQQHNITSLSKELMWGTGRLNNMLSSGNCRQNEIVTLTTKLSINSIDEFIEIFFPELKEYFKQE